MAKKTKKKIFSFQGFDAQHIQNTERYSRIIEALYNQAVSDYAVMAARIKINQDKPFLFSDYAGLKARSQKIISVLAQNITATITKGTTEEWLFAGQKNDAFIESILDVSKLSKPTLQKYQNNNLEALKVFQNRKQKGLGLSEKVWNYTQQMQTQMEMGLDVALGEGKSAQELSRELKQYLVDPDKLFRRVRDKRGVLQLSKNAAAFHPEKGKYRSSSKNALRLARTEINMAYRESDHLRWKQLDFINGFEVKLSNRHVIYDICDIVKGKYPKDFKFVGWHPQCMCYAVPILITPEQLNRDELEELRAAINGTEYRPFQSPDIVTKVPEGFTDWIKENAERSKDWKSQPYFIIDNFKGGKISGGLDIKKTS